jgi:hypothetical protein
VHRFLFASLPPRAEMPFADHNRLAFKQAVVVRQNLMKTFLPIFFLFSALAFTATAQPSPVNPPPVAEDYGKVVESLLTREAVADCIDRMDQLIDEGEHGLVDDLPHPGMIGITTKQGLHFEFSATNIQKEAIIYYLIISRNGKELKYSEATEFAALFADRAGLPHAINVREADKPIFYAQWAIEPSTWKAMHKMMIKVRTENRSVKDPLRAFTIAVEREQQARAEVLRRR